MADKDAPPSLKRRQIIDGAEIVFTAHGYEGASMSRIALQAAVSKGTLYNYFVGKSELFAAFVEQKAGTTLNQVFDPLDDQDEIDRTLRGIGLRMIDLILSPGNLVLHRIVISEAGKFPHLAEIYWEAGPQRALLHMSGWLTQQMDAGRLRATDARFAAEQFFALCQARVAMRRMLQIEHHTSAEDRALVVDGAVRLFLNSYGPAAADAPGPAGAKALAALGPKS